MCRVEHVPEETVLSLAEVELDDAETLPPDGDNSVLADEEIYPEVPPPPPPLEEPPS